MNKYATCPDCSKQSVDVSKMVQGVCPECYDEYDPDWAEYARFEAQLS